MFLLLLLLLLLCEGGELCRTGLGTLCGGPSVGIICEEIYAGVLMYVPL